MAENDTGEKTEQPTDRRRNEAREKGNIAKSTDLNAAGMMLATAAVLYFFAVRLSSDMKNLMEVSLTTPVWLRVDQPLLIERCESIIELFLEGTLVMMVVLFVSAVFLNIVQVGFMMTPDVLQLKWERLNPIEGAKRNQQLGKNLKRPFLHVRYRSSQSDDRKMKSWTTGSVGGNFTSDLDAMEVHYLSERCLITQGANNFMLLTS